MLDLILPCTQPLSRNYTKSVSVAVRWTKNPGPWKLIDVGNSKLLHELFLERHLSRKVDDFMYVPLQMPRDQRDYSQSKGIDTLDEALTKEGIYTDLTFYRVCKMVEECPYDS